MLMDINNFYPLTIKIDGYFVFHKKKKLKIPEHFKFSKQKPIVKVQISDCREPHAGKKKTFRHYRILQISVLPLIPRTTIPLPSSTGDRLNLIVFKRKKLTKLKSNEK